MLAGLALGLGGCAPSPGSPPATPSETPLAAAGIDPSERPASTPATAAPDEPVQPSWAAVAAAEAAETAIDWVSVWDESACTGARAAGDERYCQLLLMDLATHAEGTAGTLAEYAAVEPALADVAQRAAEASAAAEAWLAAWCGAYADPACAAPGEALAEAERALAVALDPWRDRATPDA